MGIFKVYICVLQITQFTELDPIASLLTDGLSCDLKLIEEHSLVPPLCDRMYCRFDRVILVL